MIDCLALLRDYSLVFAIKTGLDCAGALILLTVISPFCFAFCAHKTALLLINFDSSIITYPLVKLVVKLFVPSGMIVQRIDPVVKITIDRCTGRAHSVRPLILPGVLCRVHLQVVVISHCLRILFEPYFNLFLVALRVEIEHDLVHFILTFLHIQKVFPVVSVLLISVKVELCAVPTLMYFLPTVVFFKAHAHFGNPRKRALMHKQAQLLLIILMSLPDL